ncbi:hypothetical protein L4D20_12360 [Vibrio kyushuensis]|uniref:hypothetical protein n=1 Tax=Vibrio TaxID=662 RepID=UPI003D09BAD6
MQFDLNWDFDKQIGSTNIGLVQALPTIGPITLFPIASLGLMTVRDEYAGYVMPAVTTTVGIYSRISVTDNIWFNYNPMYTHGLGGKDNTTIPELGLFSYKDISTLTHEVAASYQFNPRQNIRLFANWDQENSSDIDVRLEFNHQF